MKTTAFKIVPSLAIVSLLIFASGCSTHVSHGYGYDYGHHTSVNLHGHASAAGVVGALIVGGLIGAAIADSKNDEQQDDRSQTDDSQLKSESQLKNESQDELVNGYSIEPPQKSDENEYQEALAGNGSKVQWYQYGKDGNCYLMGVDKGVTDVISAVPNNQCSE